MKPMVEVGIPPWMSSAACAEIPGDLWYPEKGSNQFTSNVKAVCKGCPVQRQCLDYAIANCENDGVWGGLTVKERRKLRRARESEAA
jgi:WhiB family redox-sensing transcriptional regulator